MRFAMATSGRAHESLSRQVKTHQTYLSLFENTRQTPTGESQVHLRESSAVVAITNCVRVSLGVGGSGCRPSRMLTLGQPQPQPSQTGAFGVSQPK